MTGRFLIVGTGRCGTRWAATTLTRNGLDCTHQAVRHEHVLGEAPWAWGNQLGDASYEAVPLLPQLRPEVDRVVLLVRDPTEVARSWLQLGLFTPGWKAGWVKLHQVLAEHAPAVLAEPTPEHRALRFWLEWNQLAFRHADHVLATGRLTPARLFAAIGYPAPDNPETGDRNERDTDKLPHPGPDPDLPLAVDVWPTWHVLRGLSL